MADSADGESVPMQGSGSKPYILKNTGGVYSCSCPACATSPRPSNAVAVKTAEAAGDAAEEARVGGPAAAPAKAVAEDKAAPPLLLAETWDNVTDLTGWWVSEKLDGVRLLGRLAVPVAAGQPLPRPGLVHGRAAEGAAGRRVVAGPQEVPADGEHRPPTGQKRSLEGIALCRFRRPRPGRRLRGEAGVPLRFCQTARPAVCHGPRP